MQKLAKAFFWGLVVAGVSLNAISVYLLHDVDANRIGKLNLAFAELCEEFSFFIVIASVFFLFVLWIGKKLLRLQLLAPNQRLAFSLGAMLMIAQYGIDFFVRALLPNQRGTVLTAYLLLSPVLCAAIALRFTFVKLSDNVPQA
jgi:hypothetical protein